MGDTPYRDSVKSVSRNTAEFFPQYARQGMFHLSDSCRFVWQKREFCVFA